MLKLVIITATLAMTCAAQEKITVPLANPGQPVSIKASLMNGSVTVTAAQVQQVTVTSSRKLDDGRTPSDVPPGMHRIDVGTPAPSIHQENNVITITGGMWGGSENLNIETPVNTSVQLKVLAGGHIDITGINGEIEVDETNGALNLKNVSGAIVAHCLNGNITATIDRVAPDKPMSFTSLNGKIDVTLPADTKARLRLKTDNGSIYTDFDVKMEPSPAAGRTERGRIDRTVYGTINGGGPEYLFQTMNGRILIHKK